LVYPSFTLGIPFWVKEGYAKGIATGISTPQMINRKEVVETLEVRS